MAEEYQRAVRVAEQLQRELSDLILRELRDPALDGITVTHVDLARDLRNARVYISRLDRAAGIDTEAAQADFTHAVAGLNKAAGFLGGQLAKRLKMRGAPILKFTADHALDKGDRITQLLNAARLKDSQPAAKDDEDQS